MHFYIKLLKFKVVLYLFYILLNILSHSHSVNYLIGTLVFVWIYCLIIYFKWCFLSKGGITESNAVITDVSK